MKKITELTQEQLDLLPSYRDKWIEIGLTCKPADRARAEAGIMEAYKSAKQTAPELILWGASPLEGVRIFDILIENKEHLESIPKEDIQAYVTEKAREKGYKIKNKSQVTSGLNYGQFEASWLSYYDVFQDFGVEGLEIVNGLKEICKSTGWTWLLENVVITTERPLYINRNDEGELHSETTPAIEYPDGFKLYFWNGVEIPDWVIEKPETITITKIKAERNAEISRIMREIYGTGRYLVDTKSEVIDTDTIAVDVLSPKGDSITRALIKDDLGEVYMVGTDGSTDRVYFMRVPKDTKTCVEAHNLLSGKSQNKIIMEG